MALVARYGVDGFRTIAVATKELEARDAYDRSDERELTLEGWLTFADPPLTDAGLRVRIRPATRWLPRVRGGEHRALPSQRRIRETATGSTAPDVGGKANGHPRFTANDRSTIDTKPTAAHQHEG